MRPRYGIASGRRHRHPVYDRPWNGYRLAAPVATSAASSGTISSASITPRPYATLLTFLGSRHSASRTHDTPTSPGLSLTTSWTLATYGTIEARFSQIDTDAAAWAHGSAYWARASATPGSGAITQTTGGTTFARALAVVEILPGYQHSVRPRQVALTTHESGTSIAASLDHTPGSPAMGFAWLAARTNDPTYTAPFTELAADDVGGGMQYSLAATSSPPLTATYGGLISGEARGLIYLEVGTAPIGGSGLLLESGDFLLLESNDFLLME